MEKTQRDWIKYVRVSDDWIKTYLSKQPELSKNKIKTRAYSITFSGTQQDFSSFVKYLSQSIMHFIFSEKEIKEMEKKGSISFQEAVHCLGHIDPVKDGKCGELFLFLLVESILKVPMIAHKISNLQNPNDQAKGGDGIFLGKYDNQSAILIGESKIQQRREGGITKSLSSIDRFHGHVESGKILNHELIIARKLISDDLSKDDLDYVYKCLDPTKEEYKNHIKVHPILIVYDDNKIASIENACSNRDEGEQLMNEHMQTEIKNILKKIETKISKEYKKLKSVYLDFFFIPLSDTVKFRCAFYQCTHGAPYKK